MGGALRTGESGSDTDTRNDEKCSGSWAMVLTASWVIGMKARP